MRSPYKNSVAPVQRWPSSSAAAAMVTESRGWCAGAPVTMSSAVPQCGGSDQLNAECQDLKLFLYAVTSAECFSDVLAHRERIFGPLANTSAGAVQRWGHRTRGGGRYSSSRRCLVLLREPDVRYVYCLSHRVRQSSAVSEFAFAEGAMVVVDGDMGVEVATVELCMTRAAYAELTEAERAARHLPLKLEAALPCSVHREVSNLERAVYDTALTRLTNATLAFLRRLAQHTTSFQTCRVDLMEFVDCEFQADGQKLYVYYCSREPVRFLELATFLNHIFHCRIWMKEVPLSTAVSAPAAAQSVEAATGHCNDATVL